MNSFTTRPMPRIIFGCGAIQELGFQITELGLRRPLLVTDPGIVAAGHVKRAEQILKVSGATVVIFDRVEENPTSRCVEACVEVAKSGAVDGIVGLGGGSSLDTAKGCNFVLTNGGEIEEYQGFGRAKEPMLPFLAVPTTAGTGSECQSYALISDPETHEKMACGDLKAMAAVAILDPELILSQPAAVAENSGIDALAHALESAVARNRNEYSSHYSRAAFRLIEANLETLLDHPDDEEARSCMLLGAAYAGVAIENSMLGCAHAAANPLTAKLGLVHGRAVGLMLPPTMRFNTSQDDALATYSEYAREVDPEKQSDSPEAAADRLNLRVQSLVERSNQGQTSLEPARVLNLIDELADAAARQWTAQYNPREVTKEDFVCLYKEAFDRLAK